MTGTGHTKKRMRPLMAGGILFLVVWLITLRIDGSPVFYYLERFALHDDGRYLLASAGTLVCLNTLRAIFLYLGWFNFGESLSSSSRRWRGLSWGVPLVAIPCSYALVSYIQNGPFLHFGIPALFSILTVIVMHLTTQEIRGWVGRSFIIALLVFAFQWLDLAPLLSRWGFGGGELSTAVKDLAVLEEWGRVLDALALGLFFTTCTGGIAAAALMVAASKRSAQFRKIRARDSEIAALREEALVIRGHQEVQQLVHDLRRPLTTILGLADVMVETLPDGTSLKHVKRIARTGASMNQMIEELLKEDARQEIPVSSLMEYVQSQISAFDWRRTVTVFAEKTVLERKIRVNLIRLSRALVNLLDNAHLAVKDREKQDIRLSAFMEGDSVLFVVADNGIGFSEKYSREDWGFSEWGSTGIGLAFVEDVARNHGGTVEIASHPGGASVAIRLPARGGMCDGIQHLRA